MVKKVLNILSAVAMVVECQNLNSGKRRTNGRNSSSVVTGKAGCSGFVVEAAAMREARSLGCKKRMNWLRMKMKRT